MTPQERAQATLNAHAIRDHWRRTGEQIRDLIAEAVEQDRVDRMQGVDVYVIQSDTGDIIDVTSSKQWAQWQTRDDENVPRRTVHEDTLWAGPESKEDWN